MNVTPSQIRLHIRFSSFSRRALLRHLPLLYAQVVVKTVVTRPRLEVLGRSLDHFRKKQQHAMDKHI